MGNLTNERIEQISRRFLATEPVLSPPKSKIRYLIKNNKVMVFAKTNCGFSKKAKNALLRVIPELSEKHGVEVLNIDVERDGPEMQEALEKITRVDTVPQIFIGGKYFGDGVYVARSLETRKLQSILRKAGVTLKRGAENVGMYK